MAIDQLQAKIKKTGCPIILDLSFPFDMVPPCLHDSNRTATEDYVDYCKKLLTEMKGMMPAVRFKFLHFALNGAQGLAVLADLLKTASSLGYFTMVDIPGVMSASEAELASQQFWKNDSSLNCDALLISAYPGSDIVKPFIPFCEKQKKDLFVAVKTPNKSSSELQDLLNGNRTVHIAAADYVNRYRSGLIGKNGYSHVAVSASAVSGDSIKILRAKYPNLFIMLDGIETSGGNAKNCSFAFDKLGRGAIVSAGNSVTAAWMQDEGSSEDFVTAAKESLQKLNNRLSRYIKIL